MIMVLRGFSVSSLWIFVEKIGMMMKRVIAC